MPNSGSLRGYKTVSGWVEEARLVFWGRLEKGIYTEEFQYNKIALALHNPLEYARLVLDRKMQVWVDAEDGFVM